jgi:RHS repeat-associated protein
MMLTRACALNACFLVSQFTGKERDSESGNDYFGARYYSSAMGRFMSPDYDDGPRPTNNPQRLNLYAYALNNPLRFIDEDGYTAVDRVSRAISLIGKPYGHNDQPNKYDCSGLAQFSVGTDLSNFPGTAATQYSYASSNGVFTADPSQVQAGDEVFFQNDNGTVVHVGVVQSIDPKTGAITIVAAAGKKKGVVKQTLPGKGKAGSAWGSDQTIKGYGLWHNFDTNNQGNDKEPGMFQRFTNWLWSFFPTQQEDKSSVTTTQGPATLCGGTAGKPCPK